MPKHGLPAAALPRLHRVSGLPRWGGGGGVHLGHPVQGAGGGLLLGCRHRHRGTPALLHGSGRQAIRYGTLLMLYRYVVRNYRIWAVTSTTFYWLGILLFSAWFFFIKTRNL
jgi:hypothetical protein